MKVTKYLSLGLLIAFSAAYAPNASAQEHATVPAEEPAGKTVVNWMTWEEAVEKSKTQKKKIFVDVFTDWCGWCKVMDRNTFPDTEVAKILNEDFYAVKFNAEQTADVVFNNITFKYVSAGGRGVHQLAAALLNNQMSYPNFVFLDEEFKIIPVFPGYQSLPGYRKPEEFHIFLAYVSDEIYKKMRIDDFQKNGYVSPYTTATAPKQDGGK